MSRERRRGEIVFKVGEPRINPPPGVEEITVGFSDRPLEKLFIRQIKAWKFVLRATVLEPPELAGRHVAAFYNVPADSFMPGSWKLVADAAAILGRSIADSEEIDFGAAFARKTARVRLRRVKGRGGEYAVIAKILGPVKRGLGPCP